MQNKTTIESKLFLSDQLRFIFKWQWPELGEDTREQTLLQTPGGIRGWFSVKHCSLNFNILYFVWALFVKWHGIPPQTRRPPLYALEEVVHRLFLDLQWQSALGGPHPVSRPHRRPQQNYLDKTCSILTQALWPTSHPRTSMMGGTRAARTWLAGPATMRNHAYWDQWETWPEQASLRNLQRWH